MIIHKNDLLILFFYLSNKNYIQHQRDLFVNTFIKAKSSLGFFCIFLLFCLLNSFI